MAPWAPIVVHIGAGIGLVREAKKYRFRPLLGGRKSWSGGRTWSEGGDQTPEMALVDGGVGSRQDRARLDGCRGIDEEVPGRGDGDAVRLAVREGVEERGSSFDFATPEGKARLVDAEEDIIRSMESDVLVPLI